MLLIDRRCSDSWVIGIPTHLFHSKYFRNELWFNFCFILDGEVESKHLGAYEAVLRKIAVYLTSFEVETTSLYSDDFNVGGLLEQIFHDLVENSESIIEVDSSHKWYLRIIHNWEEPKEIELHEVPISIVNLRSLVNSEWDLCLQTIIPHIDGIKHVKKIAEDTSIPINNVIDGLRNLLYYKCIKMIDIFHQTNRYRVTQNIRELAQSQDLQDACVSTVILDRSLPMPSFPLVFAFYCKLQSGNTIQQFYKKQEFEKRNIDVRKFVIFGVLNGILRRVHEYPLSNIGDNIKEGSESGNLSYDEIYFGPNQAASPHRYPRITIYK
eukprot:TRINITY_DN2307_c0_g1_i1.p1 TRINITY_DN2307_c0_g1~~TRINITY_DN2307_c0_g1_i1.p1  ORF type:complete len:324 (+),score=59.25 TRINITY_DN2307_c0_g1_i1:418-1389(+)